MIAKDKSCKQSDIARINDLKVVKLYGENCDKEALYLKTKYNRIQIEGELFKNIFFFNFKNQQMIAIFSLSGAHTNVVTFLREAPDKKYIKVKKGIMTSDIAVPSVAFDPLGIKYYILIKTRHAGDKDIGGKTCRILLENTYRYDKAQKEFMQIITDKELMRECTNG